MEASLPVVAAVLIVMGVFAFVIYFMCEVDADGQRQGG
jgi:hypothetical protein